MPTHYEWLRTPWGRLLVCADDRALRLVRFEDSRGSQRPERDWQRGGPVVEEAIRQLSAYLGGNLRRFTLPIAPEGSPFDRQVWRALRKIRFGRTDTYGQLAERIGKPGAARAVGAAAGRNPIAIVIPCHRLLARGGRLGGFSAGLHRKRALLDLEQDPLG